MAQFYKELKDLRLTQGIDLGELEKRTKINIKYLKAIEVGNFDILPVPYLRLFLRAYSEEIGGDSVRALEQLDSFLGTAKTIMVSQPLEKERKDKVLESSNENEVLPKSNRKLREDLTKGSILLVIFIFSIFIIKKIFSEDSKAIIGETGPVVINPINVISDEQLITQFTEDKFIEELISAKPPFFMTLTAKEQTAIKIKQDSLPEYSKIIRSGMEIDLKGFVFQGEMLFSHTKRLRARVNGIELDQIADYSHPIRLKVQSNPSSITVRWYKPIG